MQFCKNFERIVQSAKSNYLNKESEQTQFLENLKRIVQFSSNKNVNITNREGLWIWNRFEFSKPCSQSIQLPFNCFQTFPQFKITFFWLEICERLGNCRLCFLNNKIRTNLNANAWTTNERNSSMEFFLLILVNSSSISLSRQLPYFPCQLNLVSLQKVLSWNTAI